MLYFYSTKKPVWEVFGCLEKTETSPETLNKMTPNDPELTYCRTNIIFFKDSKNKKNPLFTEDSSFSYFGRENMNA